MANWKVNDGTQVAFGDKVYAAGETFTASEAEVQGEALSAYVSKVTESSAAKNKAQPAPKPSDNKSK